MPTGTQPPPHGSSPCPADRGFVIPAFCRTHWLVLLTLASRRKQAVHGCATLRDAGSFFPSGDFFRAALAITGALARMPVRARRGRNDRLAILGLLEARLVSADVVILGGLNEGIWPAQPDPGPWLNRPMRKTLGLDMPERQIGVTAHDFIQSFSAPRTRPHLVEPHRR